MTEKSLQVVSDNIEVGEWGLTFTEQLSPNEWYDAVLQIQKFDGKIQWYLGDLAVYAESPVTGWGESKYNELIDGTGYDYQTLRIFASVARRFDNDKRKKILESVATSQHVSFSHFREVAPLDDNFAFYWLQKAAESAWGVAKLRDEIRKWKETKELPKEEKGEMEIIPSFKQRAKSAYDNMINLAREEEAELVRIQVVKNGHVIEEELVEL